MMPQANAATSVAIRAWRDVPHSKKRIDELDAIFFEASNTKSFASAEARAAFRERWLGRYLTQHPQWAYVAVAEDGTTAGYVIGALDEGSGFDDFAAAAEAFPAHLHVNLSPRFRNLGVGAALIEAFVADAAKAGAAGVHVVTSADARNVRFYERVGFRERARTRVGSGDLVFLGRAIAQQSAASS